MPLRIRKFHRITLLLDNGGNLCIACILLLMRDIILEILKGEEMGVMRQMVDKKQCAVEEHSRVKNLLYWVSNFVFPSRNTYFLAMHEDVRIIFNSDHAPTKNVSSAPPAIDLVINSSSLYDTL